MGNSAVIASAYIGIEIENNGNVSAGSKLKGKVLLDVQKATSADYLMFRFYGQEKTKVTYSVTIQDGEGKSHTERRTAHEVVNIFSSEVILHSYTGGNVPQGRFEFPFEVAIPAGLPGYQGYNANSQDYFGVEYHCEAKLHRPGMLAWDVKNSCQILLNDEPYEAFPTPLFLEPTTSNVYLMCCIPRGTMTIGAKVNSTNVCANEKLRVDYAIHNESTSRVKALEIVLKRTVAFSAMGHKSYETHNEFHRRIEAAQLVGADPIAKIGEGSVDYNSLLKQIKEGEFGMDIPIGNDIRTTYNGRLGSVKYELSVSIKTPFGTQNVTIQIPVILHRRGGNFANQVPVMEEVHAKPADWKAVEEPIAVLVLDAPKNVSPEEFDTVAGLTRMVNESNQWQEYNVLKDWLAHSPNNANLLTSDTMFALFQCIKGDYSYYTFCQALGEAMNKPDSTNKCTCKHIAEAARAAPVAMKQPVCTSFSPYCSDKANAVEEFKVIGLTDVAMSCVMMYYSV
jgi:hypothetical protein